MKSCEIKGMLHRERTSLVFAQEIAALMNVTKEQSYSNDT